MIGSQRIARRAQQAGNHVPLPDAWRLSLGDFVREVARQSAQDHLAAFAGSLAYRALFSLFPALLAALWLLSVVDATSLVGVLNRVVTTVMPQAAGDQIAQQLRSADQEHANGSLSLPALLTAFVALASLSTTFRAAMEALNIVHGVEERRSYLKRLAVSLVMALAVTGLIVLSLVLVVSGERIAATIADATGKSVLARWAWTLAAWPAVVLAVLAAFALTYHFAPDIEQEPRPFSPGALIGVTLWLLFTVLFSLYVNHLANYQELYGALAGVAVLMIYIYASAFILLLGAEMNRVIDNSRGVTRPATARSARDAR